MKKIIFLFIFIPAISFSQWMQIRPDGEVVHSLAEGNTFIFAGIDSNGIFKTTDTGETWSQTTLVRGIIIDIAIQGSNILVADFPIGAYRSTDNGETWTKFSFFELKSVSCFEIIGNHIFAGTRDSGVFVTTNNGVDWQQTSLTLPYISALASNETTIFASSYWDGIYLSTNYGVEWIRTFTYQEIFTLVTSYWGVNSNVYAGSNNVGLFQSTDNGWTWRQTSLNFFPVWSILISQPNIIAGTVFGIFVSTNNGLTWEPRNEGMGAPVISALLLTNGYLFAGTSLSSLWRRKFSEITTSGEIPYYFNVYPNYPNPFNPITKIKYQIAKLGNVKLVIYDILGREIAVLVNEQLSPGTYEVDWNGNYYPSGVYFCRLTSGDYAATIKLILLK